MNSREYAHNHYMANQDLYRARAKRWYEEHREEAIAAATKRHAATRKRDPEKWRLRQKARNSRHYALHHEERALDQRERTKANPLLSRAASRKWREANPDKMRIAQERWRMANRERYLAHVANSRARRRGALGTHTAQEWREKLELFAYCCAYCGEPRVLVREHKVPLSRGGSNDITNIVPACQPCNARKHCLTSIEFIALGKAA